MALKAFSLWTTFSLYSRLALARRTSNTVVQSCSPGSGDVQLMSALSPTGSLEFLHPGQWLEIRLVGTGSSPNHLARIAFPFQTLLRPLTRWTREINPQDPGNVPSGMPGELKVVIIVMHSIC